MLNIKDFSQIQPISALPRKYNEFIKQAERQGVVFFLKGGRPVVLLMDVNFLKNLEDKVRLNLIRKLDEEIAWRSIQKSEQDITAGRTKKLTTQTIKRWILEGERKESLERIKRGMQEYREGKAKTLKSFQDLF